MRTQKLHELPQVAGSGLLGQRVVTTRLQFAAELVQLRGRKLSPFQYQRTVQFGL